MKKLPRISIRKPAGLFHSKFYLTLLIVLGTSFFTLCDGQFALMMSFNGTNGKYPFGSLMLSCNKFYGMTKEGGANGGGNVFSIDTNGTNYTDLWDFQYGVATNGAYPYGSLVLVGNKLFGMTEAGGANAGGIIFSFDTNGGGFKDLLDFAGVSNPMGSFPYGNLTPSGGVLFGITEYGGTSNDGVVFSIDTDGTAYKDLFNFNGVNGLNPIGSVILAGGKLFGMTMAGGLNGDGDIFSIDTNGTGFTDLFDFSGVGSGSSPEGSLTFMQGLLYGMTFKGGTNNDGIIFSIDTNGTSFKDLFNFNDSDGKEPSGDVIVSGGKLYGMAQYGAANGDGNIFSIDTNGTGYKDMHDFDNFDGENPSGVLLFMHGQLFGMTDNGGGDDDGVIFRLDTTPVKSTASIYTLTGPMGASLDVYPNPSNGVFTLKSSVVSGQSSVEVYNVLGEKVYSQLLIPNSRFVIDLSSEPNGIYLYRLIANSGELIGEGKLVIQK